MTDALDRRILRILMEDAHTPFREIAGKADTTVGTVHNRIKKMREAGIIKRFLPEVDASKLGFGICALIELKIAGGHLLEVQKELSKDPHIVAVYDVTGEMDTVFVGKFKDTPDLDRFVKHTLQHTHVKETRTRLVLNVVKEGFSPRLED
ncbi:MAG TPA: Lrp/AsnC family transcriptional regulator [Candidatus Thermoplasmatota archaeon]|nr:Lrp/AsnC family transcriptional regulator [Candidatus Thermoplasmatota archaeon]